MSLFGISCYDIFRYHLRIPSEICDIDPKLSVLPYISNSICHCETELSGNLRLDKR